MDIRQLITFITFAEEKSYLRASQKLNYAVSSLSDHISRLEEEFDVKLVESRGKRTNLTPSGEAFLVYAEQMVKLYQQTCDIMAMHRGINGKLRIATVESLALYDCIPLFNTFSSRYPQVQLSVSIGPSNTFESIIKANTADIALRLAMDSGKSDDPSLDIVTLSRRNVLFVVHPEHPLAQKEEVRVADFQHQEFVLQKEDSDYTDAIIKLMKEENISFRVNNYFDSGLMIKQYVSARYGIALLADYVVQEELDNGKLVALNWKGAPLTVAVQVIAANKEYSLPAVSAFMDVCRESYTV